MGCTCRVPVGAKPEMVEVEARYAGPAQEHIRKNGKFPNREALRAFIQQAIGGQRSADRSSSVPNPA
jgi:hypothetical protein